MRFTINIDGPVKVKVRGLKRSLNRVAEAIERCAPKRTSFSVLAVTDIPRRKREKQMDFGRKFYDQVGGIHIALAPNGPIDSKPEWSATATVLQPDGTSADVPGVTMTPSDDGLSCDVMVPETKIDMLTVSAVAPTDDESTQGTIETTSAIFTGSFAHSKATSLGGTVTDIPR